MGTVRIAHFSDTHVLSLKGARAGQFLGKRWTGAVNLALNRAKHYRVEVFELLLETLVALEPDHSICTGDLVNLALAGEFDRVSGLLGDRFADDALTLVPGNHDYYAKDAIEEGLFERHFGRWQPQDIDLGAGRYPVVRLLDEVAIVGLSSAIPTPVFMATGEVGDAQLARVKAAFEHPEVAKRFPLMMLHHPLLPDETRKMDRTRRLLDAHKVIDTIAGLGAHQPGAVVHGHNHAWRRGVVPGTQVPILQVASGSRHSSHSTAEFHIYVITNGALDRIERHIFSPDVGRFVPHDEHGKPLSGDDGESAA
ncbi:MAG: metallophosphoesterase family protein [Bradymonadia bacterium]